MSERDLSEREQGKIFVTRRIPASGFDLLRDAGVEISVGEEREDRSVSRDLLVAETGACDVLVSQLTEKLDRDVLAASPRLRGIAQMAVGFNNIDVDAAVELGIPVSNTPGVLTDTSADCAFAMLLALARRLSEAQEYLLAGRFKLWGPNLMLGADVSPGGSGRRKVLGIVGFGRIGRAVARRAEAFEMEVLHTDSSSDRGALHALLERSDFVSLHVPLNSTTRHLIAEEELRRMKSTALLINTARGPVVDEAALVRALREGEIAGAALDVFENEPELAPGLVELAREGKVLALPHIASASRDTREIMARMAAQNALAPPPRRARAARRQSGGLRVRSVASAGECRKLPATLCRLGFLVFSCRFEGLKHVLLSVGVKIFFDSDIFAAQAATHVEDGVDQQGKNEEHDIIVDIHTISQANSVPTIDSLEFQPVAPTSSLCGRSK